MLRLPPFQYHRPHTLDEALELLDRHGPEARPIAGGTDLIPNMKHRLFTPDHLVALGGIAEMKGIDDEGDGALRIGAGETLAAVAADPAVEAAVPGLAHAAGQVAGPQLRNRGTLGGNLCLDTRCTYYNQTEFWRKSLGYCLKKDGDTCHVTKVGAKCVAAHSADTPPVLMAVGAQVELQGPDGGRVIPVDDFFVPDGIWNSRREPGELVVALRIPAAGMVPGAREPVHSEAGVPSGSGGGEATPAGANHGGRPLRRRTGTLKLRQRKAVDFPLLTLGVALWLDEEDRVVALRGVVTGLGSRPRLLSGWDDIAQGERLTEEVVDALAQRAHQQCRPLENMIVDPAWRRAMVPVQVRRLLTSMVASA